MGRCLRCDKQLYSQNSKEHWRKHSGRGLCSNCHTAVSATGEIVDYPCKRQKLDDVMYEWSILRVCGFSKQQAAEKLGMKFSAFDRAYYRARSAGDPRALPPI